VKEFDASTTMPLPDPAPDRILDSIGVTLVTTLPHGTIIRLIHQGEFPPPVQIHRGRVGWRMSDVQRWIAGLVSVRMGAEA
jgi:predicted DNA-binding transcriptional regulator AlpA